MKKIIFLFSFLLFAVCSQAQFRLAVSGTPSWSDLGGGQYSATVNFHADLTGNSYAVAGIADTMQLFTSRGQIFDLFSVADKTFSSATLTVDYVSGTNSAPVGQGMVFTPNTNGLVPDVPFGSSGATAQFNQMPVTYNAAIASATIDSTNIIQSDFTQTANRTQSIAGFNQVWNSTAVSPLMKWDGSNGRISTHGSTGTYAMNILGKLWLEDSATDENIGIGKLALGSITAGVGQQNIGIGYKSLNANTEGLYNTAIGYESMPLNTTGNYNLAIGRFTLNKNVTGGNNTAIGTNALRNNTASNNTAIGFTAMETNVSGTANTAIGVASLAANTASLNTAIGYESLTLNTSGSSNTAIGYRSLDVNVDGAFNTAIGVNSLGANTSGTNNVSIGVNNLAANTSGAQNIAIGTASVGGNGSNNVGIGNEALKSNTSGFTNVAIGASALTGNLDGYSNTAIGASGLSSNTSGVSNSTLGRDALYNNTTGSNNVAAGFEAGRYITGGATINQLSNNSTYIGANTKSFASSTTNETVLGYDATGLGSNTVKVGTSVTKVALGDNYVFNADQALGATQNRYSLKYNSTSNELEAAAVMHDQTAASGATTVITDADNASFEYVYVAQVTGSGTIIHLPNPAASLAGLIYKIKFVGIDAGQTVTITTVSGGSVIEDKTLGVTTSVTVPDVGDYWEYTFKLNSTQTIWLQGS